MSQMYVNDIFITEKWDEKSLPYFFFIRTLYVMDILLLKKTGWGENFIALKFLYVQKGYF